MIFKVLKHSYIFFVSLDKATAVNQLIYVDDYKMDSHEVLYKYLWSPEDES